MMRRSEAFELGRHQLRSPVSCSCAAIPERRAWETTVPPSRILGVVIPEIDPLVAENKICLPSAKKPILPLHVRPALMAGVAIVERHGPDMLAMLWSKTIGQNHTRFGELIASMLSTAEQPDGLSLLQHM